MTPVQWADVPAVTTLLAVRYAEAPARRRAGLVTLFAALTWPWWLLTVAVLRPTLWHHERRVVLEIHRAGSDPMRSWRATVPPAVILVLLILPLLDDRLLVTFGRWTMLLAVLVAVFATSYCVLAFLPYPKKLRATGPRPTYDWKATHAVSSRHTPPGRGPGHTVMSELVTHLAAGELLYVEPRDERVAHLYRRHLQLNDVPGATGRLVGRVRPYPRTEE